MFEMLVSWGGVQEREREAERRIQEERRRKEEEEEDLRREQELQVGH